MDNEFALKVSFQELTNSSLSLLIFTVSCICSALIVYIINTIINIYYTIKEKNMEFFKRDVNYLID
jgi:hypothetical protein